MNTVETLRNEREEMSFCRGIWVLRGSETSECRKRKWGANMEENMQEKGFGRAV